MNYHCDACDKTFIKIKKTDINKIKKHCEGVKHNANLLRYNSGNMGVRETGESDDKYYCGYCDKYMLNTLKSINRHEISDRHIKKVGTASIIQNNRMLEGKHHCYTCNTDIQNEKYNIDRHENGAKHKKNIEKGNY